MYLFHFQLPRFLLKPILFIKNKYIDILYEHILIKKRFNISIDYLYIFTYYNNFIRRTK